LIGPLSVPVLNQLTLDVAVLGVDAFDPVMGASAHNEAEAEVNARIARQAKRVVVVADSTKLCRSAFAKILAVSEVDVLITDTAADAAAISELTAAGVEVIQA
jgi:DeoR/GlpR family transcriptional regulator of sugar metabolism